MVTDHQVRRLIMLINKEQTLAIAASKSGMNEKTARKYLKSGKLPSQSKKSHNWKTREDPFEQIWDDIVPFFESNPGLEAKTVFNYLQRLQPDLFQDGQLRTFQRKVKIWRALEGPSKEVFFPQQHRPGYLSCSDFTHMNHLGITINGVLFPHLVFHFVLTYSNWETGNICFSENFESLSGGLQNALWKLGGSTEIHRTDNLSAAVYRNLNEREFTPRYQALLKHYKLEGITINPGKSNENGDVEQSHHRFKKAVEQALLLRGSRDFSNRRQYANFLSKIFSQLNAGRTERFAEEIKHLRALPQNRLDDFKKMKAKVGPGSTITVCHNVYSVHSRMIGENVEIRLFPDYLEVWYAQRRVDRFERLRGERRHHIQYRHIIEWLVRKPGAFENYRYRDDLFPTTRFRMAYDALKKRNPSKASKEYLKILYKAAMEIEAEVDKALNIIFELEIDVTVEALEIVLSEFKSDDWSERDVTVRKVDLSSYDHLLISNYSQENPCGNYYQ